MIKKLADLLRREAAKTNWIVAGSAFVLLVLEAAVFWAVGWLLDMPVSAWIVPLVITVITTVVCSFILVWVVERRGVGLQRRVLSYVEDEVRDLQAASDRGRALQAMASTLRATLSFERVVEAAMDVCGLALEESGISSRSLIGVVYLYDQAVLRPVASRSLVAHDMQRHISGDRGIIGDALRHAEPAVTDDPASDPEIGNLLTFRHCKTAVCVPLRVGFQIFGAMIIGTEEPVAFTAGQIALFNSVGDHAVIALQNAKLYQDLKAEKEHLIAADEAARKELARDLHDGPTQTVAAIAMRLNFIRSLIKRDPEQALNEMAKVEELAREASRNIRGMLFTLRPLLLETEGLAAAIENVMQRHEELVGINMRLVGGEYSSLLNEQAQGVVFSIIEEALGNARKHSQAKTVEVRFWREDDLFVAQVTDDGIGFDVQSVNAGYNARGSLGLVNMRERAERIDGSVRIESVLDQGTTVTLVVPIGKQSQGMMNGHPQ